MFSSSLVAVEILAGNSGRYDPFLSRKLLDRWWTILSFLLLGIIHCSIVFPTTLKPFVAKHQHDGYTM